MSRQDQPIQDSLSDETPPLRGLSTGGLIVGPLVAIAVYAALGSSVATIAAPPPGSLTEPGRRVLALAALMAVWWFTEAIPISVTALLPLALLPLLKTTTPSAAAAPYADPIIFLFLGGLLLGQALERCGLHRRMALATILAIGASLVALVDVHAREHGAAAWDKKSIANFATAMYLGIAYAASIGGIGTPIGTPPNVVMIGYAHEAYGLKIGFGQWMAIGVPLILILLPACWLLLIALHPIKAVTIPGGREFIRAESRSLGDVRWAEWATAGVFLLAAAGWIFAKPISGALDLSWTIRSGQTVKTINPLTDTTVAIIAAVLLFLIPANWKKREFLLDWSTAQRLPWGVLLLFGGGLSLAESMKATGLDTYLGALFAHAGTMPSLMIMFVVVLGIVLASEIGSNTALATTLMPVLGAAAVGLKVDPLTLLFAATLAASCGFMLPVATPPNAIAYATGRITMRQMFRAGAGLDLICAVVIVAFFWLAGGAILERVGLHLPMSAP